MTVSTAYTPLTYNGNSATTNFSVTWPFFTGSLVVTAIDADGVETVKTLATHYTVSGGTDSQGKPATGTVTMLTAPASGTQLRVTRNTSKTQTSTWGENDNFPQATIEAAFDKGILIAQELAAHAVDDITGDFLQLDSSGTEDVWDAENHKLRNLVDGTEDDDAITKAQLDAAVLGESGFIQSGTGAIQRTWQDRGRDWVSVMDFIPTALHDGIRAGTNSTTLTTYIQAAIDAAATAKRALYIPSGRYKTGNLTLSSTAGDYVVYGDGRQSVLEAAADGVTFFTLSDNYAFSHKTFRGLAFDGMGGVNCRGISCNKTRETKVIDCHFEDLRYNTLVDRCRGFWLNNITCRNSGTFYFHSTDDLDYCQQILAANISDPVGTDINTTYSVNAWWYLKDVVNGCLVNCTMAGMAGNSRCFSISGKTEGVFMHNCVVGWPSVGLFMEGVAYVTQAATIYPQYCGFVNCGFDQPSVSSAVLIGDYHYMTGCWLANGTIRTNTDSGVIVRANSNSIKLKDCYIGYHQKNGLAIETGADDILVDGCDFTNNNGSAGAFYDIAASGLTAGELVVRNCTSTLTANINGKLVKNGNTLDGVQVPDSDHSHALSLATGSNLTADRTITINPGDADRTLTLSGNATLNQDVSTAGSPSFATTLLVQRTGADAAMQISRPEVHGDGVYVGRTDYIGRDSAAASEVYARVRGYAVQDNAGVEDGRLDFGVVSGGTIADKLQLNGSSLNPSTSGGLSLGTTALPFSAAYLNNTGLHLKDTNASHDLIVKPGADITADRTLTVTTDNSDQTLRVRGATVTPGRSLNVDTGSAQTTAVTTAEDLLSYTIPANTLASGMRVRVLTWGTTAANGNTKTGRLFFGSTNMGGWSAALNNISWSVEAEIFVTGSAAEEYVRTSLTSSLQVTTATITEDTTASIVVKFQGQNGTASSGDIVCQGLLVEILNG